MNNLDFAGSNLIFTMTTGKYIYLINVVHRLICLNIIAINGSRISSLSASMAAGVNLLVFKIYFPCPYTLKIHISLTCKLLFPPICLKLHCTAKVCCYTKDISYIILFFKCVSTSVLHKFTNSLTDSLMDT